MNRSNRVPFVKNQHACTLSAIPSHQSNTNIMKRKMFVATVDDKQVVWYLVKKFLWIALVGLGSSCLESKISNSIKPHYILALLSRNNATWNKQRGLPVGWDYCSLVTFYRSNEWGNVSTKENLTWMGTRKESTTSHLVSSSTKPQLKVAYIPPSWRHGTSTDVIIIISWVCNGSRFVGSTTNPWPSSNV